MRGMTPFFAPPLQGRGRGGVRASARLEDSSTVLVKAMFGASSLALLLTPAPLAAQTVVTSPKADRLSVTLYRDPARGPYNPMQLQRLGGFALVTETRRVRLPRGRATLRFEGVADGIVPVSAVVEGLPGGVVEKNRDERILSPASLVDGTLGRQVTLTRTDRESGRSVSEDATILAGPGDGVVLRTASGVEALRCSGLAEGLRFRGVPAGLSVRPTLSVDTVSGAARTATVTLSYLATGFDWSASYVATVAADGRTLDLFAWMTLANSNPEGFGNAEVQAVAGRLNRQRLPVLPAAARNLRLRCYPLGTTTSDLPEGELEQASDIVVTASRAVAPMAMMAPPPPPPPAPPPPPEDLGDLKLYRVPGRVSVASNGQKQVALLAASDVPFQRRYRLRVAGGQALAPTPAAAVLVVENREEDRLGIALPAGTVSLYADRPGGRLLVGQGSLSDRAAGETIRLNAGVGATVQIEQRAVAPGRMLLSATNAGGTPARLEILVGGSVRPLTAGDPSFREADGAMTWTATVPPGGRAELTYRTE